MALKCPICNNVMADDAIACPTCGYRMLGTTETFTPLQIGADGIVVDQSEHTYDLCIVRGPQTGLDIDLKEGELAIGRDPRCDIFLNDMTVSRDHASIEVSGSGCVIRDHGSVNGVWVNDRLVEACTLKPGDLIQIGAFCLVYRERI